MVLKMTTKRRNGTQIETQAKKVKTLKNEGKNADPKVKIRHAKDKQGNFEKKTGIKKSTSNKQPSGPKGKVIELTEKPEDWNEFKKKKKELRLKRRQNRTGFDVVVRSKQIGEKLRCKTLKGGDIERNKLVNELHSLLSKKDHYSRFVLAHDTSRVVQWLLKYSSEIVKAQISQELVPITIEMLQSKYGIFCVKRLLKYGNQTTKSSIVDKMYGCAVKLSTHVVSAPVFEYAYTNCASPRQRHHLVQEFFGEIYKNSKDDNVKHLRDVYEQSPSLKMGTLGATKANLMKVINKKLLDSALFQTVLHQFLTECTNEDRADLISILIPHIVVISNSKDGSRAAMQCIWHGTNKDKKLAVKTIKEHVLELSKHEHGHCTIITLLDAIDDTVMLHKIIISEILKGAKDLAENEWGRKVLLWLVAPADPTCFHPVFVKELEKGRTNSSSKKDPNIRRQEILVYSIDVLLNLVSEEPHFWLKNSSLGYEMFAITKVGKGDTMKKAFDSIVQVIIDPDWKVKTKDGHEVPGIEDAGMHMVLKKLAKNDARLQDAGDSTFGSSLIEVLTGEILARWLIFNRGCFILVAIYENSTTELKKAMKKIVKKHKELLTLQESAGSKILLQKLNE